MKLSKPKYIFVTGGVASSLGKGIISASIARLLQGGAPFQIADQDFPAVSAKLIELRRWLVAHGATSRDVDVRPEDQPPADED